MLCKPSGGALLFFFPSPLKNEAITGRVGKPGLNKVLFPIYLTSLLTASCWRKQKAMAKRISCWITPPRSTVIRRSAAACMKSSRSKGTEHFPAAAITPAIRRIWRRWALSKRKKGVTSCIWADRIHGTKNRPPDMIRSDGFAFLSDIEYYSRPMRR